MLCLSGLAPNSGRGGAPAKNTILQIKLPRSGPPWFAEGAANQSNGALSFAARAQGVS
jgi:hypothetical protein